METEVEIVKKKLDIVEIINKVLPLKKRGRHYVACCPFHSEKTPSFTVSPELQIFKCFGCGKAGDVFTFYQEYHRIDFREALEELAKIANVPLTKTPKMTQGEARKKLLITINHEVAKFYHYILTTHKLGKKPMEYLSKRGITIETINLFKIGFSPIDPRLITSYLAKKGYSKDDLVATGTFGYSQYKSHQLYDRFLDRLIFPLTDYRDRILGFSGRILPFSQKPNLAKYINSPETEIYHKSQMLFGLNLAKDAIRSQGSVIITEGEFDMISPFQNSVKNIVAIKGTAFTAEQLQLLKRYTQSLVLALDSDFAGNHAALKSIELADSMDFDIQVLSLGDKYKDPDEAITNDPEFFKNQLNHLIPVWDFVINSALKTYSVDTPQGKKQVMSLVLPFLVKINNSVIRSDYLKKLSSLLGSDLDSILDEAAKYNSKNITTTSSKTSTSIPTTFLEKLEESLLVLILGAKNPPKIIQKNKSLIPPFVTPKYQKIYTLLLESSVYNLESIQNSIPPELQTLFQNLFFNATNQPLDSLDRLKEIKKAINQISLVTVKHKLNHLSQEIARLENSGSDTQLKEIELQYNIALSQLSSLQIKKS